MIDDFFQFLVVLFSNSREGICGFVWKEKRWDGCVCGWLEFCWIELVVGLLSRISETRVVEIINWYYLFCSKCQLMDIQLKVSRCGVH